MSVRAGVLSLSLCIVLNLSIRSKADCASTGTAASIATPLLWKRTWLLSNWATMLRLWLWQLWLSVDCWSDSA